MIIKRLSLTNYKNIKAATLQFSDKLNCIVGGNGMGKTNLLDSIYILSFTRSYQYLPDSLIIHHDEEMAIVSENTSGKMARRRVSFWDSVGVRVKNSGVIKRSTARCRTILGYFLQ